MSKVIDRFVPHIDLRKELEELVDENAYEIMLQRTSHKVRCSCFNEQYQEANPRCPKCVGTGWLFKFEKQKCFKQDIISSSDGDILVTPMGKLVQGYAKFFFPYDVAVTRKDYIWEVAFKRGKPVKLKAMYQIEDLSEQRGIYGHVEYKMCIAKLEPFDTDFKNTYIGKAWRDING